MLKASYYNHILNDDNEGYVLFNSKTLATAKFSSNDLNEIKDLLSGTNQYPIDAELHSLLVEKKFLVPHELDEKIEIRDRLWKGRKDTAQCSLTIAPTIGCNFNCSYCFEDESARSTYDYMSLEVQDALVDLLEIHFRKYSTEYFSVCWFGGEPLLAPDIINRLSKKFIAICREFNIKYEASIITNGYKLQEKTAQLLQNCQVKSAQVTIDGPELIHDSRRILKGGQGSFKRIMKNLAIASNYIDISVRINVDKQNYTYLDSLLEEMNFLDKKNISMYPARVVSDPNTDPKFSVALDSKSYHDVQKKFILDSETKGFDAVSPPRLVANACAADQEYSYMVGPKGEMYQCWEDFGNAELSIGNILSGKDKQEEYIHKYLDFDPTRDPKCSKCSVLPLCMGGCPKQRLKHEGIPQCSPYKFNLRDIVINHMMKTTKEKNPGQFTQSVQSMRIESVSEYREFFHSPILNNYVYMLVPNTTDLDLYLEKIKNMTSPLNAADISLLKQCKDLLDKEKCPDLYYWAKCIAEKRNLLGATHSKTVIEYIEKNILHGSFVDFLHKNNKELLKEFLNVPKDILQLYRINIYLDSKEAYKFLTKLIAIFQSEKTFCDMIERVEVAKDNGETNHVGPTYPTIILYINPLYTTEQNHQKYIDLIAEQANQIAGNLFGKAISSEFSHPYSEKITITQGYRLYKYYLNTLGLLSDIYSPESNYAFYKNSSEFLLKNKTC